MPRPRWDRERRVNSASNPDGELTEAVWPWVAATVVYLRHHWPMAMGLLFTLAGWLAINSYLLGGVARTAEDSIARLNSLAARLETSDRELTTARAHYDDLAARIATLEHDGPAIVREVVARLNSLEVGYHALYPMVSGDLHDLVGGLRTLEERSRGDKERFDGLTAADAEIRARLLGMQTRQEQLADRIGGLPGATR